MRALFAAQLEVGRQAVEGNTVHAAVKLLDQGAGLVRIAAGAAQVRADLLSQEGEAFVGVAVADMDYRNFFHKVASFGIGL